MTPTRFNIGAGDFHDPEWTNVDLPSDHYAWAQGDNFIAHDLTTLADLPIETASADIIYCSHVIEHVPDAAVAKLLSEAHRILKPGGGLRLTCPDFDLMVRNWRRGNVPFFMPHITHVGSRRMAMDVGASCTQLFLHWIASQCAEIDDAPAMRKFSDAEVTALLETLGAEGAADHITSFATFDPERPDSHVTWFNADKLRGMLRDAGFGNIYRSGFGQSCYPQMRSVLQFDRHHSVSLYMEAAR